MKKPRVKISVIPQSPGVAIVGWWALVDIVEPRDGRRGQFIFRVRSEMHPTKKAAREWAKEWCRVAGKALAEKGAE